ncbi:hypothetical protein KR059_007100, partial [Drosophila kikkawai]
IQSLPSAGEEELTEPSVTNSAVSASDLADCRAENWLLKKKLREYEVTIENLEQLVSTLVEKQHQILSDMFNLRTENHELQSECHLQREYHSMERNALLKQLNDAQNRDMILVSLATPSGHSKCCKSPSHRKEDQCQYGNESNDEQESISEEENEDHSGESSAPSSEYSSPSPTCSESEDTDVDNDLSGDKSSDSNSETD